MNTARLTPGIPLLLNGVTKRYGDNTILNELDLHIPSGQFVAVVGRSGGGKSTLLRLLAGLEKPNAGELLAGATPLAAIQDDTRMMFQDARLLPWKTVIDNVGLGLKGVWRDAALQALASAPSSRMASLLRKTRWRPRAASAPCRAASRNPRFCGLRITRAPRRRAKSSGVRSPDALSTMTVSKLAPR